MSQCVPSWDLDESSAQPSLNLRAHSNDVPSLDYEVAELTWENGQLAMHGLGPPRVAKKKYASWDKPCAGAGAGTLESIVNQATRHPHLTDPARENVNELAPWFDHRSAMVNPGRSASMTMTMDALVPCNNSIHRNNSQENSRQMLESVPGAGTRVGSCSGAADGGRVAPARICSCKTNASVTVSESTAACGGIGDGRHGTATPDTCERELGGGGFTSTSLWSPENTSSGEEYTKTTSGDDHDSVYHSRSQRETGHDHESGKKKGTWKSSVSTKRSRAAAIHSQSERKRRDKINQRMKTLQKLVPNSSKTDKASILDEVIEYLKQLQAQVQMMSRMNMPHMMLPLALQQQLQMSMMAPAMGMGVMDLNTIGRAAGLPPITATGMPPVVPPAAAAAAATFMPMPSWDVQGGDRLPSPPVMPDLLSTFLACQSQRSMTTDAYSRLAALYQQFQQNPGSGSKNQL